MKKYFKKVKGFSVVEVILATVLVTILITGIAGAMSYGISSASKSNQGSFATYLAQEGIEALRNMRDNNFTNLTDGTHGLALVSNQWTFSGTSDTTSIYTRSVVITTQDTDTKRAVVSVTWNGQTYTQIIELTQWQATPPVTTSVGMLVYGDGGTTTDTIKYRLLGTTGVWGAINNTADIDSGSTNKALVSLKLYSSKTRNEKILISKHCAGGTNTYIYGQVWNGTIWGNVVQLGTYANCTSPQIEDYAATYLRSGDLMVSYSDGTVIPKWRIWNGGYWSSQLSATTTTGIPQWLDIQARPGTNEVMMKIYNSASDSITEYFNGGAYIATNWSAVTSHITTGGSLTNHYEDFAWSPVTPTNGILIFGQTNNDTSLSGRPWTANGTGSGSWGTTVNATALASRFENTDLTPRPATTAEYVACTKARLSPVTLSCFRASTVPAWTAATNGTISTTLDGTGTQMGFDFEYEKAGAEGVIFYADETTTPKFKTYTASTNTFSASATNLTTTTGVAKSVKIKQSPTDNDLMVMIGDANGDFYTQVWNGTTNAMYSTPAGKAWTSQGTNGYNSQSFYYDFAWNNTLPNAAQIQNTYNVGTGTVSSQTVTFPQAVTAGDTIVVAIDSWTGGACTLSGGSVTDNKGGNTYTSITEATSSGHCLSVWYGYVNTGGSNFIVTVTPPAVRWMTVGIHEYRGIINPTPLNGSNTNTSLALVTAATAGNVTTTNATDMIFGAFYHSSATAINAAPGTSFDQRVYYTDGANEPLYTEERFVNATGTYTASQTFASTTGYGGVTVAFKTQ